MSATFCCRLRSGPVDGAWASAQVAGPDAGAIVLFLGTVRAQARGRAVRHLEYQAYPRMVEAELERIGAEVAAEQAILRAAVEHASGRLEIGQASVAVAVAAAHRAPAFAAASAILERLKERVPIWKKESYSDGSSWIGQGS